METVNEVAKENADQKTTRILAVVALVVTGIFAILHLSFALITLPRFIRFYDLAGEAIPIMTRFLINIGPFWLALFVVVLDFGLLWIAYRLARRYQSWIVLAPIPLYFALLTIFGLVLSAPMRDISNLIR